MKNEELRCYPRNKGYNIVDVWALELVGKCQEDENTKKNFPFRLPLTQDFLLANIRYGKCLDICSALKYKFSNFPPFSTTLISAVPIKGII